MKKIVSIVLLASFVMALAIAIPASATTTTTTTTSTVNLSAGLTCMQTAVDTRDTAIIAAWDTLSASAKTALQTRKNALKTAWGIQAKKDRRIQIAKAWSDFKYTSKTARGTFNQSRDAAWNKFKNDALTCKTTYKTPVTDDLGVKGNDGNL